MAITDPLIGQQLGDYQIIDTLGKGGMAHVYRGYDPLLERYAAVKVIDVHNAVALDEAEYQERFQREARAIARLSHPNIVGVYQFGTRGSLYYMAMVFIEGRDLGQLLREARSRDERLPTSQVLQIIRDIASALDYAHEQGVIHRDIKPSNIMVTPEGHAILTDFGLALSVPDGTIGTTFGTAHYIAPEQALSSANAVPQSDLYSLGVVMYQMLTGRVPFDDPTITNVVIKHLSETPPPPRTVNPSLSVEVEAVMLRVLDKEPMNRFPNGKALVEALENALGPAYTTDPKPSPRTTGVFPSIEPDSDSTANLDRTPHTPPSNPAIEAARAAIQQAQRITSEHSQTDRPSPRVATGEQPKARTGDNPRAAVRQTGEAAKPQRSRALPLLAVGALVVLVIAGLFLAAQSPTEPPQPTEVSTLTRPATEVAQVAVTDEATPQTAVTAEATPQTVMPTEAASQAVVVTTEAAPSETPEETPSSPTPEPPTATSTPSVTPRPTQPPRTLTPERGAPPVSNRREVMLVYDTGTLILINRSETAVDIRDLVFRRVAPNGTEYNFNSNQWAGDNVVLRAVPPGNCVQIWTVSFSELPPPDYCTNRLAWRLVGTLRQFWIAPQDDAEFEVRRNNRVLATCPVNGGECIIPVSALND
jgi:serine/threonine protein kinase